MSRTLGPVVAGTWYPGSAGALRREIGDLIDRAATGAIEQPPTVRAIIAPHAGLAYSGGVAAAGFRLLRGLRFDRVVLVGPSHYAAFRGAVVPDATSYRTPLGDIPIDVATVEQLIGSPYIRRDNAPFAREHCLEMELPFMQETLADGWRLVPMLLGPDASGAVADAIAGALRPHAGPETLVVASSDFTHYGVRFGFVPFSDRVPDRIRDLDRGALERIEAQDVDGFEAYLDRTGATVCGRNAIDVLMRLMPDDSRARTVLYDTSGAMTGDWEHSVSYASVIYDRPTTE